MRHHITRSSLMAAAIVLGLAGSLHAQQLLDNTTLSTNVTDQVGGQTVPGSQRTISLTSITCSNCTFGAGTVIYVDLEEMIVTRQWVSGASNIPVTRGADGTIPAPHNTAATVFLGPPNRFRSHDPAVGMCTRAAIPEGGFLPWLNIHTGAGWSCDNAYGANGKWFVTYPYAINGQALSRVLN